MKDEISQEYLERGKKVIYPQRLDQWKKLYTDFPALGHFYPWKALFALEEMESGRFNAKTLLLEAKKESRLSYLCIQNAILFFSKNGPDIIDEICPEELTALTSIIRKENARFEKELKAGKGKGEE